MSSSDILDKVVPSMVKANTVSAMKSLLLTPSMEFSMGPLKPSNSAVRSRLMGKLVVVSAADPNGHIFIL